MPDVTPVSMHGARDVEDNRLLQQGEYALLVEGYFGVIVERCRARVPAQDAVDVAANVVVRLMEELDRGKRYTVPYRVVVHMVTTWKIKEFFEPGRFTQVDLDERLGRNDPTEGLDEDVDFRLDLAWLLEGLTEREREVVSRRILELPPGEIAAQLGIERNNVDQIWNRAKPKLMEKLSA